MARKKSSRITSDVGSYAERVSRLRLDLFDAIARRGEVMRELATVESRFPERGMATAGNAEIYVVAGFLVRELRMLERSAFKIREEISRLEAERKAVRR